MSTRLALSLLALGLVSARAGEITIGRKDTVAVDGTKYIYLGLDHSDSCHVMISGGGKIWMYGIPSPESVPPAPGFTLATHEGKLYHVVRANDSILVLDQLDKTAPPFALPASYLVGTEGFFNGELDTTINYRYYQVWGWGWGVDSTGRKWMGVTVERDRGREQAPFSLSIGQSVTWHILKITLAALHYGRDSQVQFILAYEVLAEDAVRPPLRPGVPAQRADRSADALGREPGSRRGSPRFRLPQ